MREFEFIQSVFDFSDLFLNGLALSFTVISAYIVALYYFLHAAGFFLKFVAFTFFTGVLIPLGLFLYAATRYFIGLSEYGRELEKRQDSVNEGMSWFVDTILSLPLEAASIYPWLLGGTVYFALFHLTFFHKWNPR